MWPQAPDPRKAPGPCSHIHTQASMYRDTPTQTHTSTHKHAPMPINTHTRTNMYHSTGSLCILVSLVSIQWGIGEGVSHPSHNCRLSLHLSPGLAVMGAGAGCSRSSEYEEDLMTATVISTLSPTLRAREAPCPLYPRFLPSFNKRAKLRLGTWQPSFPCSCL